jgi:acylphosphatase
MRRRFIVRGVVQGVNFRNTATDQARRLGLTGRVWNAADGSVECVAEGEAEALDRFREWLARGPRMAEVEQVESADLEGDARYAEFQISGSPAG